MPFSDYLCFLDQHSAGRGEQQLPAVGESHVEEGQMIPNRPLLNQIPSQFQDSPTEGSPSVSSGLHELTNAGFGGMRTLKKREIRNNLTTI